MLAQAQVEILRYTHSTGSLQSRLYVFLRLLGLCRDRGGRPSCRIGERCRRGIEGEYGGRLNRLHIVR